MFTCSILNLESNDGYQLVHSTSGSKTFYLLFLLQSATEKNQWEFHDPKVEVLYHIRISWRYIPLHTPYIGLISGRYIQLRFLKWQMKVAQLA